MLDCWLLLPKATRRTAPVALHRGPSCPSAPANSSASITIHYPRSISPHLRLGQSFSCVGDSLLLRPPLLRLLPPPFQPPSPHGLDLLSRPFLPVSCLSHRPLGLWSQQRSDQAARLQLPFTCAACQTPNHLVPSLPLVPPSLFLQPQGYPEITATGSAVASCFSTLSLPPFSLERQGDNVAGFPIR